MRAGERGRWGEDAVESHLQECGHRVEARNLRLQRGELDLVTSRDDRIWFVEVKSRGRRDRGAPRRRVDRAKRRALYAAAREYLRKARWAGDYGFLVASVVPRAEDGAPRVRCDFLPMCPRDHECSR